MTVGLNFGFLMLLRYFIYSLSLCIDIEGGFSRELSATRMIRRKSHCLKNKDSRKPSSSSSYIFDTKDK